MFPRPAALMAMLLASAPCARADSTYQLLTPKTLASCPLALNVAVEPMYSYPPRPTGEIRCHCRVVGTAKGVAHSRVVGSLCIRRAGELVVETSVCPEWHDDVVIFRWDIGRDMVENSVFSIGLFVEQSSGAPPRLSADFWSLHLGEFLAESN